MFKAGFRAAICAVMLAPAIGCASMISGTSEPIAVNTVPPGAVCTLERNGTVIGQVMAPGSINVTKSRDPITVHCNKEGYAETDEACKSGTCGWVAGNILFGLIGAPIGLITDFSTGAVNDYEDTVTVILKPMPTDPQGAVALSHYPMMTTK